MGKSIVKSNKAAQVVPIKNDFANPAIRNQFPQLREVNVPAITEESQNLITAYKDLNEPLRNFNNLQRKHLIVGLIVFTVLGIGMFIGQHFGNNRAVASAEMNNLIPAGAVTTVNEHYHYEKSCYKGKNGEDVCLTRSSLKK